MRKNMSNRDYEPSKKEQDKWDPPWTDGTR